MSEFVLYAQMGFWHIINWEGLDHILFVTALCLRYLWTDWKQLLVMVTAFTIGHSVTLALSTLQFIHFSRNWTEFLIAATILITAFSNLTVKDFRFTAKLPLIYFFALIFGLIHGLGFSSALKSFVGKDQSIVLPLLAFNLGLEAGQLIIVAIVLLLSFVLVRLIGFNRREFLVFVSGAIAAVALQMAIERLPVHKNTTDAAFVAASLPLANNNCLIYSERKNDTIIH
ncbi:HupE/UreJ family protein [Deminuibacter soli]|uniref:HupE/UreJ family protein n=1 Tax=Deminuibacter soli TaxID=2291815 RepID=A0A3E1NMQ6_9BACT|nr:HupE/UreJ family protein [Deminuibacter soli]RFM29098.1 HupE/UreJ family protein [Deminuibacter soli]